MRAEVLALIGVDASPLIALPSLPLAFSVISRADLLVSGRDNADSHRDSRTLAVLENATSRLLVPWWDRCMCLLDLRTLRCVVHSSSSVSSPTFFKIVESQVEEYQRMELSGYISSTSYSLDTGIPT